MSISVLIPVFNENVSILVNSIAAQINTLPNCNIDLILLDDGSESKYQQQFEAYKTLKNVQVFFNETNLGRALTRKKLASFSQKQYLLYLDCDTQIIENNFLEKYLIILKDEFDVVVGGTIYLPKKPENLLKILHWKYGTLRESVSTAGAFKSNNFLIKKNIFKAIPICNAIKGYGHEDTFIGIWLAENKYCIETIANPVYHLGIDENTYFLEKTENALLNLKAMSNIVNGAILKKQVKLFRYYYWLKKYQLIVPIKTFYNIAKSSIRKNLLSKNPSMFLLDFYKLGFFASIKEVE